MKKLYILAIATVLIPYFVCAQAEIQNPNTAPGGPGLYWKTSGNNNTVDGTNFIGTTDNVPFNIRVNNVATGRLDTRGNIYFGQGAGNNNATPYSNIGIGRGALQNATNRSNLVAIGDSALFNNGVGVTLGTQAFANTAIGSKTLFNNTIGASNTAAGFNSLLSNTSGNYNAAFGELALYNNTTGSLNTAVGSRSLFSNTIGFENTALGQGALYSNTSGIYNTALGIASLYSNTTDGRNTAVGAYSLYNNNGTGNTAIGYNAMHANTNGSYNISVGHEALFKNTNGGGNVSIGGLGNNDIGNGNTACGLTALNYNTSGSYNTAIGYYNSYSSTPTTGNNNTSLGYYALVPLPNNNNQVRIGNTAVTYAGIQVGWTITSDIYWKEDIKNINNALDIVNMLRPVDFIRKSVTETVVGAESQRPTVERILTPNPNGTREWGFIAQEVDEVLKKNGMHNSGIISKDTEGLLGVRYNDFIPLLTKAIQEQQKQIEDLQRQNAELMKMLKR